ncbi:MAG TPA: hypothetical protein VG796_14825 [Verrucomicrobiales bacterium]|nr:hypothetical protein [Verrucomicrobiales bacterium]
MSAPMTSGTENEKTSSCSDDSQTIEQLLAKEAELEAEVLRLEAINSELKDELERVLRMPERDKGD